MKPMVRLEIGVTCMQVRVPRIHIGDDVSSECSNIRVPMFGVQTSKNRVLSAPQRDYICGADRKMVIFYVYLRNITKKSRF